MKLDSYPTFSSIDLNEIRRKNNMAKADLIPNQEKVKLNGVEVNKEEVDSLIEKTDKNTKVIKESEGSYIQRLND